MVEANPIKFYLAKYFFLVFGSVLWMLALAYVFMFQSDKHVLIALLYFVLGVVLLSLNAVVSDKVRRVAVGKNKVVIIEDHRNIRFAWPEVKAFKVVPFLNMYRLKVRGKKKSFYFFPSKSIESAFGQLTELSPDTPDDAAVSTPSEKS